MTYTDEKVNLVINKMTQEQYERAKEEGILNDNELYITPDQDIEIPTKTSELENDSGFITIEDVPTKTSQLENDSGFLDGEDKDELNKRIDLIEATSHPNMNVIGSPTFSEGSVGGFSDEDYLMFPTSVNVGNNNVDFYMTFTTGDDVSTQQNILDSWCGLALAIQNGHFILAASSNGTSFDVANGAIAVEANTPYDIKVSFRYENDKYIVGLGVKDGESYNVDAQILMNAPLFATPTYWGGANPTSGANHIFGGTINLNKCWMVWNEEVIWRGYSELPIPTKVSQLENDSGFITQEAIPTNISYFQNDQGYIDAGGKSEIQSDYEGKINDLKNNLELQIGQKADANDIPTSTSQLTNDSGFITIEDVPQGSEAIYECVNDDQSVNVKLVKDVYGKWSVENDVGIDNILNALMVVKTNDGVKMYQPTDAYYDPERTEHMETWWELGDWEHTGASVETIRDELLNYTWSDTIGHSFTNTDIKWYADEESYMGNNTYQIFILKVIDDNGQTKVGEFERQNFYKIPTNTSDLVNDDGFITASDVDDKIENIPSTTISGEYEDGTSFSFDVLVKNS